MVSKQRYKTTEIGKVPADWDVVTLENLIEERKEKTTKINQYDILTSARTGLYLQSEYFNRVVASENNIGYRVIRKNDFTYRSMSDDGLFVFNRLENMDVGMVSPAYSVFRFKNQNVSDFYKYYLNSSVFLSNVLKDIQGGTRLALRFSALKKMKVAFPPLLEQRKIAAILTSVDDAIEKTEAIIKQTEKVKKGLMQRLLTRGIGHMKFKKTEIGEIPEEWKIVKIEEVVTNIIGGGTPSRKIEQFYKGNIPWVTVKDLKHHELDTAMEFISEEAVIKSATNIIPAGNVIVATRMAIGKAFKNLVDVAINQDLKALIPNSKLITTDFLLWSYLNKSEQIESLGSGTTVKGIRLEQLKEIKIALPSLAEQQKIVSIITTVDKKLNVEQKYLRQLQTIKEGLMQVLLTGKVRVKVDENDEVVV